MTRSRGDRHRADRRTAALVVILAGLVVAVPAIGFSCTGGGSAARRELDVSLPRDLRAAPVVRVALVRGRDARAKVEVRGPYEIFASEDPAARPSFAGEALAPADHAVEPAPGSGLAFGGYAFRPGWLRVAPKTAGTLVVDGTAYRGDLVARALADRTLLVLNRVNLEEYTAGVVGCEMPLEFPAAALGAQAIASRTYGLHALRSRAGEPYDVMDDQSSQVYKGLFREDDRARRATVDTLGVVLTYGERILKAYFHSTCGGETSSAAFVFGDADIPPLAGGPCGFCEKSKYFTWRHSVERAALREKLAREGPHLAVAEVQRVEVVSRGPAGYAGKVRIVHPAGAVEIPATKLRWIVGTSAVRSTAFDVEDAGGETIAFVGRGWGHGVGMCQIGAGGMAKAGHDAAAILRRYYPAAELRRIYAAGDGASGTTGATAGGG